MLVEQDNIQFTILYIAGETLDGQQDQMPHPDLHHCAFLPAVCEIRLKRAGYPMSAATAMENMHRLHSCKLWSTKEDKPARMIEESAEIHSQILNALGHTVTTDGVLQKAG